MGYTLFVIAVMLVLPAGAAIVEMWRKKEHPLELIGKWFIFFGVGIRLLVASVVQMVNPGFTLDMLGADNELLIVVRELGFANLLLACVALYSVHQREYRILGTGGALFMGFAGMLHVGKIGSGMSPKEAVAMWSDLWICLVAIVYLAYRFLAGPPKQESDR
jgi:hypothetical protein